MSSLKSTNTQSQTERQAAQASNIKAVLCVHIGNNIIIIIITPKGLFIWKPN